MSSPKLTIVAATGRLEASCWTNYHANEVVTLTARVNIFDEKAFDEQATPASGRQWRVANCPINNRWTNNAIGTVTSNEIGTDFNAFAAPLLFR